jgi:8-oxo-dGTP diphosphatase
MTIIINNLLFLYRMKKSIKKDIYYPNPKLYVAVDCIIFGFDGKTLKLLLWKTDTAPETGKWSLLGGFVDPKETLDEAAQRILFARTGLHDIYMEQLFTFGSLERNPFQRILSVAFTALIKFHPDLNAIVEKNDSKWFSVKELPKPIYDHGEMIRKAILKLRTDIRYRPLGFELLPEKFTLPQLQLLYEAILDKKLDTRNFSRKILSMGFLEKLDIKDKSTSRKGAMLYRFDKRKYDELLKRGFNFEV